MFGNRAIAIREMQTDFTDVTVAGRCEADSGGCRGKICSVSFYITQSGRTMC